MVPSEKRSGQAPCLAHAARRRPRVHQAPAIVQAHHAGYAQKQLHHRPRRPQLLEPKERLKHLLPADGVVRVRPVQRRHTALLLKVLPHARNRQLDLPTNTELHAAKMRRLASTTRSNATIDASFAHTDSAPIGRYLPLGLRRMVSAVARRRCAICSDTLPFRMSAVSTVTSISSAESCVSGTTAPAPPVKARRRAARQAPPDRTRHPRPSPPPQPSPAAAAAETC
ncbi:hypothetical protein ERJ75_001288600 [Trypanosoma vivax]|nr:hypothetical protein ERJ75_001288600 [Trypanosoma vivax]